MDRSLISNIAHSDHPIAAPVSAANLDKLLRRTKLGEGARILDLGCGEAMWTLRALELFPGSTADGVDISSGALAAAAKDAEARGLSERIRLHEMGAAEFRAAEPYDLVLCVGSTHAFDGLTPSLHAIRQLTRPEGLVLVGEGYWETPPSPELEAEIGKYPDLAGLVAQAEEPGYRTIYAHTSSSAEWDEYEWSWTGSLVRWAMDNPGPDGDTALAAALEHRDMWLKGYRGKLGFVTLLLRHTS
ncbi:SAM-dependent methyltransferase [Nonomuraea jiangxiensis]|uniref:Methyltransferase domain-containing protein n=1 Tax=Nonomuraea jiangxiensis TaxID=633440 RepID=A0A1G8JHT2_9ACTN|nr:class I SAM-dependent methyltransferase [Nonomuraea jiangxiensis]SDI30651.1 Methyltransferase domain-containing protein [Nonomuraea jiangxiensis]